MRIPGDRRIDFPNIRFRDGDVFGESAIGIHAQNFHVLADVRFARAALVALAAGNVHFRADEVALAHAGDFIAHGRHFPAELVAGNERRVNAPLRPGIPIVDMQIRAAHRRDLHLNQNVLPPKRRDPYLAHFRSRLGFRLNHRHHCACHGILSPFPVTPGPKPRNLLLPDFHPVKAVAVSPRNHADRSAGFSLGAGKTLNLSTSCQSCSRDWSNAKK